ncbi:MAG: sugar phosphate isomerase/epimerase [Bacteroidales bacterium]|nr:sugar phosphate isomerase/epimerase [Bacteroidales bacterium]
MKKSLLALSVALCLASCSASRRAIPVSNGLVEGPRPSENFKLGVAGYTYRQFSIDETLGSLRGMGAKYLSIKDFWLPLDSSEKTMADFKAKCASYDVDPYILGPIYMRSEKDIDNAFAYVARFGHKMFIGVPNYELLDYLTAKVAETGIRVAIHTHGPDNAPFPNIKEVADRVGDPSKGIGCCMDLGHSARYGDNIIEDIYKYKEFIYDIHIKDETEASKAGKTWEIGRGVMDFKAIIIALREIGYQGNISIEFEKNANAPQTGVAESLGYLRAICDLTE